MAKLFTLYVLFGQWHVIYMFNWNILFFFRSRTTLLPRCGLAPRISRFSCKRGKCYDMQAKYQIQVTISILLCYYSLYVPIGNHWHFCPCWWNKCIVDTYIRNSRIYLSININCIKYSRKYIIKLRTYWGSYIKFSREISRYKESKQNKREFRTWGWYLAWIIKWLARSHQSKRFATKISE